MPSVGQLVCCVLSASSIVGAARSARAQADLGLVWASSGAAISVSFGRPVEVGFIVDLRFSVLVRGTVFTGCAPNNRAGVGQYGFVSWYPQTGFRFGSGLHGGAQVFPYTDFLDGELGWSYFLRRRSHALHLGLVGEALPAQTGWGGLQLPLGFELPVSGRERLPFFTASVGFRVPGTFAMPGFFACEV